MIKKEEIFVNESHWRNMNESELNDFVKKIFDYYRENGFPYYPTDMETRKKEFQKLKNFNYKSLIQNNVIKQSMHGLGLAWSYFPHAFNVRCNDMMTPYEAFMDDEIFMNVIRKRLKMGTYISDSGIRKMLKIYTGVQGVSNFRPTAAACIYDIFAKNGVVWDMCAGWGGRYLGAVIGGIKHYIGTEPSTLTYKGLINLANDFNENMKFNFYCVGSEDFLPEKNSLDLCFTSPPYFDTEKYSNEPTQSYIRFNNEKDWVNGFLFQTLKNCYYGLKKDKYLIINICDIKKNNNFSLEKETIIIAQKIGFVFINEMKLALSNVNLKNKNSKFKYEPIFIFLKK